MHYKHANIFQIGRILKPLFEKNSFLWSELFSKLLVLIKGLDSSTIFILCIDWRSHVFYLAYKLRIIFVKWSGLFGCTAWNCWFIDCGRSQHSVFCRRVFRWVGIYCSFLNILRPRRLIIVRLCSSQQTVWAFCFTDFFTERSVVSLPLERVEYCAPILRRFGRKLFAEHCLCTICVTYAEKLLISIYVKFLCILGAVKIRTTS